jgi:hypothetical protein
LGVLDDEFELLAEHAAGGVDPLDGEQGPLMRRLAQAGFLA